MTISEQQLPCYSFSKKDAVLFTDGVQVEFLTAASNASLSESLLLPLSLHAYAAILERGHARVGSHFEFVDFAECRRWYRQGALEFSRTWLQELELHFQVEDINIAELDAPSQFQLFVTAFYINETAERIIHAHPEIETFHIVAAENRLPLDFYFDSDVPAAVLRFACERLGRPVRTIVMKHRPRYLVPGIPYRPAMNGQSGLLLAGDETAVAPQSSGPIVGFAPSTINNHRQIHEAIRNLSSSAIFLPSVFEMPHTFYDRQPDENEVVYRLSADDGEWSTGVSAELTELRRRFFERRFDSTLPSCIIRNPNLDFQFDYIFGRRWLSYANMIRRAARFVARMPLDLFIHSDHFTPEGAIFARLYRRRKTRIIVTLHSGWPVNRNWASWDSSDSAIVPSKTCADHIRELSGMSNVFITGPPTTCTYRSLLHGERYAENARRVEARRKIVLLIANALDLNCFPLTALDSHFKTFSFLARVPASLADRVLLAIRTKPGDLGEKPILYVQLCGFPPESLAFLEGLDFSQAVSIADCVVGINLATSGCFEVLRKGIPLIHLQTADVLSLEPDLPSDVVPRITELRQIWPTIEALLFDERARQKLVETQRRFVAVDFRPTLSGREDPIEAVLRRQLEYRNHPILYRSLRAIRHLIFGRTDSKRRAALLYENNLPLCQEGCAGFVDDVLLGSDGTAVAVGWAVDLLIKQPAKAIHLFLDGRWESMYSRIQSRPDIAIYFNDKHLEQSGFTVHFVPGGEEKVAAISVYAELHNGTFFKLQQDEDKTQGPVKA